MSDRECHRCGTGYRDYYRARDGARLCPRCWPAPEARVPASREVLEEEVTRALWETAQRHGQAAETGLNLTLRSMVHEGGHALGAVAAGWEVGHITMTEDGGARTQTYRQAGEDPIWVAAVALCGPTAEENLLGGSDVSTWADDIAYAERALEVLPEGERAAAMDAAWDLADRIISVNEDYCFALARAAGPDGFASPELIRSILGEPEWRYRERVEARPVESRFDVGQVGVRTTTGSMGVRSEVPGEMIRRSRHNPVLNIVTYDPDRPPPGRTRDWVLTWNAMQDASEAMDWPLVRRLADRLAATR